MFFDSFYEEDLMVTRMMSIFAGKAKNAQTHKRTKFILTTVVKHGAVLRSFVINISVALRDFDC